MANYIHIYKGTITAGGTNGDMCTEIGNTTGNYINYLLNATNSEEAVVTLAIRCQNGYQTLDNAVLTIAGTNAAKYELSLDNATFTSSLTFAAPLTNNQIFYLKAKSASTEVPQDDTSTNLVINCNRVITIASL